MTDTARPDGGRAALAGQLAAGARSEPEVEPGQRLFGDRPGALASGGRDERHATSTSRVLCWGRTRSRTRAIRSSARTPSASAS